MKTVKALGLVILSILLFTPTFLGEVKAETDDSIDVNYKVEFLSPDTNTYYTELMPMNFTVEWSKGNWTHWIVPRYLLSIDNGSIVGTEQFKEGGQYIDFENTNPAITVTNETINVSNLTDGVHTLTVYADGTINDADLVLTYFNITLSTTTFIIGSPSLSILENINNLAMIIISVIVVVVVSVALIYLKRYKRKVS